MIKRTLFSSLALATLGGLLFSSCTNSTSPNNPVVGAPSNVMALSKDANSISIEWTRGANDTAADTIIVASSVGVSSVPTTTSANQATLTGLASGTLYTITVASVGGRSSSIQWMTAVRTSGLLLYSFSSSGQSGLVLNGATGHAQVVSASSTNIGTMDFFLDDNKHDNTITAPSGLSFEGAQFLNGSGETWRNSYIDGAARYIPGGLDADYSSTNFSTQLSGMVAAGVNSYDIPNDAVYNTKGSRVLLVETQDGNFAKIEIVPDPTTHQLYSVAGNGDKYITVNVSYQPVAGQPYAARPGKPASSDKPSRISAQ